MALLLLKSNVRELRRTLPCLGVVEEKTLLCSGEVMRELRSTLRCLGIVVRELGSEVCIYRRTLPCSGTEVRVREFGRGVEEDPPILRCCMKFRMTLTYIYICIYIEDELRPNRRYINVKIHDVNFLYI
jgi:hypothetical protein